MKSALTHHQHIESERTVEVFCDGSERPTHQVTVRVWRSNVSLSIRTPHGFLDVPMDGEAAVLVAQSLHDAVVEAACSPRGKA